MERIASALKKIDADVVFLQEVDRGADRTGRLDQLQILLSRLDYRWWTGCVYHRARYVPSPWYRPLGKVELWLAILSRAPLKSATRIALPLLAESPLVQRFNLKRALLTAEIPGFTLGCTHLSAFSKGDGTLPRQIACLKDWVLKQENPCILGGDFNALPPGDTPARLPDAEEYADTSPPLAPLLACMDSAIPKLLSPEANTYLPPFKNVPDRVLDYLLVRGCSVEAGKVGEAEKDISDHLPVWAILRKPDRP
jgi:endonuclease/exonuclease/phosphatase family metal-dependent hydrolase